MPYVLIPLQQNTNVLQSESEFPPSYDHGMRIAAPPSQDCSPHIYLALSDIFDIPSGRNFGRDFDSINDLYASEDINITYIRQNFGSPLFPSFNASVTAELQKGKRELAMLELEPEN